MTAFPTLGILGGGQLGRMTALAAIRMGLRVKTLAPQHEGPVAGLGDTVVADWLDPAVLAEFARDCDTVTVESEWAPAERVAPVLEGRTKLFPTPGSLLLIRDKGIQKRTLAASGLPVPPFVACGTIDEALEAAREFGFPVVLKRFRGSYDGYGNATTRSEQEIIDAWPGLADRDGLLVEAWVPFEQELSVLVARRPGGQHVVYPVAYTEQRDHRCHAVVVPANVSASVVAESSRLAVQAAEAFGIVGLLGVELFLEPGGRVSINELAPRPHNTGHYSIEGCHTSQFENHVRAIMDWPLGDPSLRDRCAVMVNVLGHRSGLSRSDHLPEALSIPGVAIHVYGKDTVRPRRKMGHVTVTGADPIDVRARAERAAELINL